MYKKEEESKDFDWVVNNLLSIKDNLNGNILNLLFETGVSISKTNTSSTSARISIKIKNPNKTTNSTIFYSFNSDNRLRQLLSHYLNPSYKTKKESETLNFKTGNKTLVIKKTMENSFVLVISDPENGMMTSGDVTISASNFYNLIEMMNSILNNWLSVNQTSINQSLLKIFLYKVDDLTTKVENNFRKISNILEKMNAPKDITREIELINKQREKYKEKEILLETEIDEDDIPSKEDDDTPIYDISHFDIVDDTETEIEESDIQSQFKEELSDIDSILLDDDDQDIMNKLNNNLKIIDKKKNVTVVVESPLINNFLNNDFDNLDKFLTKYTFLTIDTDDINFSPIKELLTRSLGREFSECFIDNYDSYYMFEAYTISLIKENENILITGNDYKLNLPERKIIYFENDKCLNNNESFFKFCVEVVVLYFYLKIFISSLEKKKVIVEKDSVFTIFKYKKMLNFISYILHSFVVSSMKRFLNEDKFVEKLTQKFNSLSKDKTFIEMFNSDYSKITMENFSITENVINNFISKYPSMASNAKLVNIEDIDFNKEFSKLQLNITDPIESYYNVKKLFTFDLISQKFKIFMEYLEKEKSNDISSFKQCLNYDDIVHVLQQKTFDDKNVYKLKRVLDLLSDDQVSGITPRTLKNKIKNLNESDDIVIYNVMNKNNMDAIEESVELLDDELRAIEADLFS